VDNVSIMSPQDLQFRQAEPVNDTRKRCVACKTPIVSTYFHAQGQVVCPSCAERIKAGQQAPPAFSLARAALYGAGAALLGCIIYAAVAILLNLEIGIIAIVVGILVGKAVRKGSNGLGGRPQQILAVLLTYFSITTSYVPVYIYQISKNPKAVQQQRTEQTQVPARPMNPGVAIVTALLLVAAAPFLNLSSGIGALISLFIIFIGLRQAWALTGRREILIMGPYEAAAA
jgi:hypothetical protein